MVMEANWTLRGWAGYFHFRNSVTVQPSFQLPTSFGRQKSKKF
jgi:hypothetical protein